MPRKAVKKETFGPWIEDFQPHNILIDASLNVVGVIRLGMGISNTDSTYHHDGSCRKDLGQKLLLSRLEYWVHGTVLDFGNRFVPALDVFFRAIRVEEDELALRQKKEQDEKQQQQQKEWSIDQHVEVLRLGERDAVRPSERMRRNWESGAFWANYAARKSYGFEPVFWGFLNERWFGRNVEGGYEKRMHFAVREGGGPDGVILREEVVGEQGPENRRKGLEKARTYLARILPNLD